MILNRKYKMVLAIFNDLFIITFITYVTSLLAEAVSPGFVSSVVDLNALLVLLILLTVISIYGGKFPTAMTSWQKYYFGFFALANLYALQRIFTLQFSRALLGLSLSILLISAIIVSLILLYDRGSSN